MRRLIFGNNDDDDEIIDVYKPEELAKNPYLGWQPRSLAPSKDDPPFSWRQCFDGREFRGPDPPVVNGTRKHPACLENPSNLGVVPEVNATWVPDVTMVRTMMLRGRDIEGNPFPPRPSRVLCEDIDKKGRASKATS